MNDQDLDAAISAAAPVSERQLADLAARVRGLAAVAVDDVRDEPALVASAPASSGPAGADDTWWQAEELIPSGRPAGGGRRWVAVPLVAVAATVLALLAVVPRGETVRPQRVSAPMAAAAEEAPRYLVGLPGWQVDRVDEVTGDEGEMTFSNGSDDLELRWSPVARQAELVADRAAASSHTEAVEVHGHAATLFRYTDSDDYTTVWADGDAVLEARARIADLAAYKAVLAGLRTVGIDEWLAALPDEAVRPDERAQVVDEMLVGLPLPEGFDREALRRGSAVRDEYQLGAEVAAAVACWWFGSWVAATEAGDAVAAQRAVDALATSPDWPVLRKMDARGDYPEVLWMYAEEMAGDGKVEGGKTLTVKESYADALGCRPARVAAAA